MDSGLSGTAVQGGALEMQRRGERLDDLAAACGYLLEMEDTVLDPKTGELMDPYTRGARAETLTMVAGGYRAR